MDQFAVFTLEHYLRHVVSGMSDYHRDFYGHADLTDQGELAQVRGPRVIVAVVPDQPRPLGYPRGPALERPYVDLTEVAVYVETPLVVKNALPPPDELEGYTALHIPMIEAIRDFLFTFRPGLEVPPEVTALGCGREVYGMWQPIPPENQAPRADHWTHVFHIILQKQEAT